MRLLVVVPGFGSPRLEFKRELLKRNLRLIRSTFSAANSIHVKIFNYGTETSGISGISGIEVEEIMGAGIVGQFLYRHVTPAVIEDGGYDYIILMLDDIELVAAKSEGGEGFNIDRMIRNYEHYQFDILSPSLAAGSKFSHAYMLQQGEGVGEDKGVIRIAQCVEFFFYLMSPSAYQKWWGLLDEKSCWLWGIDYAFYNYGIKAGLMDGMTIVHHIKGASYVAGLPSGYDELEYNRARLRLQAQSLPYTRIRMIL